MKSMIFILAILSVPALAAEPKKKTVCSATLNSDEEIKMFKKRLGTKDFDYVELTELPPKEFDPEKDEARTSKPMEPDWLDNACEQKVQCDILVVSGHFGGSFFGKSGKSLSLEQLEAASCQSSCNGILRRPKEVFLFGCNTLAGKEEDFRTPEQYRQVLVDDGFDPATAEQIVAFRYSSVGDSFANRMRGVFQGVPRIYGFSSIAPAGKNVEAMLETYFKESEKTGYYNQGNFLSAKPVKNETFAKALRLTHVSQAAGLEATEDYTSAVCLLNDPMRPYAEKLKWIEGSLTGKQMLAHLPYITKFMSEHPGAGSAASARSNDEQSATFEWGDKDFENFENLAKFKKSKELLRDLVLRPLESIMSVQAKAIEFQDMMGWLSKTERDELNFKLFLGDEKTKWTRERLDLVMSTINNSLTPPPETEAGFDRIPKQNLHNPFFLEALAQFRPSNLELLRELARIARDPSETESVRAGAKTALAYSNTEFAENFVIEEIAQPNNDAKFFISRLLRRTPKVQAALEADMERSLDNLNMPAFGIFAASTKAVKSETLREKLKMRLDRLLSSGREPKGKYECQEIPVLSRMIGNPEGPSDSDLRLWVKLAKGCDSQAYQDLFMNFSKNFPARTLPRDVADEFGESLFAEGSKIPNLSLLPAMMSKVGGEFPKTEAALQNYFRRNFMAGRAADFQRNQGETFAMLFTPMLVHNAPDVEEFMTKAATSPELGKYSLQISALFSADISSANREAIFSHMWEKNQRELLNSGMAPYALAMNPKKVNQESLTLVLRQSQLYSLLLPSWDSSPNFVKIKKTIQAALADDAFLLPVLELIKNANVKSMEYRNAMTILSYLDPNSSKAALSRLRDLASVKDPSPLREASRFALLGLKDEKTREMVEQDIGASACQTSIETYSSPLAPFVLDFLVAQAQAELKLGENLENAGYFLLSPAAKQDPETAEKIASLYLEQMMKRKAPLERTTITALYYAGRKPEKYKMLLERFAAYAEESKAPRISPSVVVAIVSRSLPENTDMQEKMAKLVRGAKKAEDLQYLTPGLSGFKGWSDTVVLAFRDRLREPLDSESREDVANHFRREILSMKQIRILNEVFEKAPEASVRKIWNREGD